MAMDVGGAIKGNRVDILYPNRKEAFKFGRRDITLKILGKSR
jgi:3D (Asp-Asp-Asp) domain-containing protein